MRVNWSFTEGALALVMQTETHAMLQQIETPAVSQTTLAPEVLALLWALKIDITGLADMPLNQAGDAVCERIERVLAAADPALLRAA